MDLKLVNRLQCQDARLRMVYAGALSQGLISNMTQQLEKEAEETSLSMSEATNLFTIFIELSQNIVNYAHKREDCHRQEGVLMFGYCIDSAEMFIQSQNLIQLEDQLKIEPKLKEIQAMDKDMIKQKYRELRKSGRDAHDKGAGIGFYEIAKRCSDIDYEFSQISDGQVSFKFRADLAVKKSIKE